MSDQIIDTPILIEALSEAALITFEWRIVSANAASRALLGPNLEGAALDAVISHPAALEALERCGSADDEEVELTGLDGSRRSWLMRTARLANGACLVRFVDRSEARAAEQMRVDFVANASHELRTPLSTILGYAETLGEEGELPSDLRIRFGSTIREESMRMLQIIEDLMSLSRIEADRFLAPNEVVSIDEVVEIAAGNASRLRGAAQCELILDIAPGIPPVRGDRSQLLQVVDNLLSNAVRYGSTGPGSKVRLSATRTDGWVTLTVTDYGPGIPREHLPRVTERFYRVDPARSRESGGTGLGLAIVKHIVERHRGTLDIKSIVGEGTSVSVRLPAAAS